MIKLWRQWPPLFSSWLISLYLLLTLFSFWFLPLYSFLSSSTPSFKSVICAWTALFSSRTLFLSDLLEYWFKDSTLVMMCSMATCLYFWRSLRFRVSCSMSSGCIIWSVDRWIPFSIFIDSARIWSLWALADTILAWKRLTSLFKKRIS